MSEHDPDTRDHYKIIVVHPNGENRSEIYLPPSRVDDVEHIGRAVVREIRRLNVLPLFRPSSS
jgi:hypothetical protein